MEQARKENQQGALNLPENFANAGRKKNTLTATSALSTSRIPVLSKSRFPPEPKQSQQHSLLHPTCPSSVKSQGPKAACVGSVPAGAKLAKSHSREALGEMQLSISGQRNVTEYNASNGKETSTAGFMPDLATLASILSNTGLNKQVASAAHKPSLAQRIPLNRNGASSASAGVGRNSLYANPTHVSHIPRFTSEATTNNPQSSSLGLNTQQLKTLLATVQNFGPEVEAMLNQPQENLEVGLWKDSGARSKADCLSSITEAGGKEQSVWDGTPVSQAASSWCPDLTGRKEITGELCEAEEFVPDPAAKASILMDVGLSHSALGGTGKVSLAQRVPLKGAQKPLVACGSTRGEHDFQLRTHLSAPPKGTYGRVSCRSTRGFQGLEASEGRPTDKPGSRCSVDYSPYGQARRVPVTRPGPQSLHSNAWTSNRGLVPSSNAVNQVRGAQGLTETPEVKWVDGLSPQTDTATTTKDDSAMTWEKIAVRLFHNDSQASAQKAPCVPMSAHEKAKLQRIELLAQLLCEEMKGVKDDVPPSVAELHKLMSARCSSIPEVPKPLPGPSPSVCKQAPALDVLGSEPSTMLAQPAGPSPSVPLPSSRARDTTVLDPAKRLKERLDDLHNLYEARLNDECAFYTARTTTAPQPRVPRCQEPVAKTLDSQDAMGFIPISTLLPPLSEAELSSTRESGP